MVPRIPASFHGSSSPARMAAAVIPIWAVRNATVSVSNSMPCSRPHAITRAVTASGSSMVMSMSSSELCPLVSVTLSSPIVSITSKYIAPTSVLDDGVGSVAALDGDAHGEIAGERRQPPARGRRRPS